MRTPERLSLTPAMRTSKPACSFYVVVAAPAVISIMPLLHKMCILKHIRMVLAFRRTQAGQARLARISNHISLRWTQPESANGRAASLN
jgi:hypothetical protein